MLGAPDHAVLGCRDLTEASTFFRSLGFTAGPVAPVPTGTADLLYGLDTATVERFMHVPGAVGGRIRLIETPYPSLRSGPLQQGGYALDVYTRDIDRARDELSAEGYTCSPVARYDMQGTPFAEMRVDGPDGLRVVLIDGPRRRSMLDADEVRLYSEAQAYVFFVADPDADAGFWTGKAGLQQLRDTEMPDTPLGDLLDLPVRAGGAQQRDAAGHHGEPAGSLRMVLYWRPEPDAPSARVELISFPGRELAPAADRRPLSAGLAAIGFAVDDVPAAALAVGAELHLTGGADGGPVATGVSPAGVPFHLTGTAGRT